MCVCAHICVCVYVCVFKAGVGGWNQTGGCGYVEACV